MNDENTINQMHPNLRELVKDFLLKCKHPFEIKFGGPMQSIANNDNGVDYFHTMVLFHDPNADSGMGESGAIKWHQGTRGGEFRFRVIAREVINPKYRNHERRRSVETRSQTRALKEMLTYIKPFTVVDMAKEYQRTADRVMHDWRNEPARTTFGTFGLSDSAIAREMYNLKAQGVTFVTDEFKHMSTTGLECYEETQRRASVQMDAYFVRFVKDGRISVLGHNTNPLLMDTYLSFEQLPEFIKEGVGVLQIMKNGDKIAGFGARINENTYWVIKKGEQNT